MKIKGDSIFSNFFKSERLKSGRSKFAGTIKLFIVISLFVLSAGSAYSQQNVGIGTNSPDNSAILHLFANDKGFLVPKMTTAERNSIVTPANGLLIFNTTTNQFEYNSGSPASPVWTGVISLSLNSGNIWVGNAMNQAAAVAMSGDATISNTGALTLSNSGVTSGTYGNATTVPQIAVDSKGRITSVTNTLITGVSPVGSALNSTNIWIGNASNQAAAAIMSGDATLSNTGVLTLANSGVTAGAYGNSTTVPQITVDTKGRITGVTATTITGVAPGGAAGGDLAGTYPNPTLAALTPNPSGTWKSVTVDTKGRVTAGTNPTTLAGYGITDALSTTLNSGQILIGNTFNIATASTLNGDATLSYTGALTLANSGVTAGAYGNSTTVPQITVDAKGRITGVTTAAISGVAPGGAAGGDLAGTYPNPTLAALTPNPSGTWKSVTVDTKGRVTAGINPTTLAGYGIIDALSTTLNSGQILVGNTSNTAAAVTMSGDATLSNLGALTLANTGVTAGAYGDATTVPQITVDAKGRVTGVTTATISGVAPGGAAGGDLSGNYPNPTVARIQGNNVSSTAPTNGQVLKWNGTSSAWEPATENSGTVTSVGLSMPADFTVTNSPVTVSGTLTASWASQTANKVFASPDGGSGPPAFRVLSDADIPDNITASNYLPLSGGALTGNITFTGNQTVDGVDISAHAADPDAHHARQHSMTSAQDHTANNWQMFYSNGSGNVTELALGSNDYVLKSNGNSAAPSWVDPATLISGNNWSRSGNNISSGDFIGTTSGNTQDFIIKTDDTSRITVKSNGKVGIGTGTILDTIKLQVEGDEYINGDLVVTGEIDPLSLTLQPQATAPAAVAGKLYYDGNINSIKVYNGSSWQTVGTTGSGSISSVGSMTNGSAFSDASASGQWLGLGSSAGRIIFDDQATDYINFMNANVGIGNNAPAYPLDVNGTIRTGSDSQNGEIKIHDKKSGFEAIVRADSNMTADAAFILPPNTGTNNQVLTTDGNGNLSWTTPAGGSSLPTGTDGQTLRNNGSDWVASSTIYDDGTNIGIGSTNPNEKLTVNGSLAIAEASSAPNNSSGFGKLFVKNSDNQLWYTDDVGNTRQLSYEYAIYEDRKPSGTDGGGFNSGSWQTRTLNTTVDSSGGSSISRNGNTITLNTGTYRIVASAPAYRVSSHQTRFRQTSGTQATVLLGTSELSMSTGAGIQSNYFTLSRSFIDGIINVTSDGTSFELQHNCSATKTVNGFGLNAGLGENEVYARVYIQKIK